MQQLETSLHLFEPPQYRSAESAWTSDYDEAVRHSLGHLTWDAATVLALVGLCYCTGDRTLVNEVVRRPWLSGPRGDAELQPIPPHDTYAEPAKDIATRLQQLLLEEARVVCAGRSEIYVLVSGGLDSRIVAGTVAALHRRGELSTKPIGVSWGLSNSRDVAYGKRTAELLDFDWQHIDIDADLMIKNVEASADMLGALVSPIHLHGMLWFENVSPGALVLAGSYGDGVGRAEFMKRHVLELDLLRPNDAFGILQPNALRVGIEGMQQDFERLRQRTPHAPRYAVCEHEMEAHYMRGLIGHAMDIINKFCTVYQMFTQPDVYSYMWSVHPALRDDSVYAELLESLNPDLARLPWARTNRAARGRTVGAQADLRPDYHAYSEWAQGPVHEAYRSSVDPEWLEATGLFSAKSVRRLEQAMLDGQRTFEGTGRPPYDIWLWLASFRRFADRLEQAGATPQLPVAQIAEADAQPVAVQPPGTGFLRRQLRKSSTLFKSYRALRRFVLRRRAIRNYPLKNRYAS